MSVGPETGTCPACGMIVPLVNYRPADAWRESEGGYLARHTRVGTRPGSKCRGSFGTWLERRVGRPSTVVR